MVKKKEDSKPTAEYMALVVEVKDLKKALNAKADNKDQADAWKFVNENNDATIVKNDSTFTWCLKDCHPQPIWCPRKNCLTKSEWKAKIQKRKKDKAEASAKKNVISKDFKMVLTALIGKDKFDSIEETYLK